MLGPRRFTEEWNCIPRLKVPSINILLLSDIWEHSKYEQGFPTAELNTFTAATLTSELRPDVPVFARVLLLVVGLELPERLEILQAQRAQEALAHFGRVPEGRRAARRHRGRACCPQRLPGCGGRIVIRYCLKRTRPGPCDRRRKTGAEGPGLGASPSRGPLPVPPVLSGPFRGPAQAPPRAGGRPRREMGGA